MKNPGASSVVGFYVFIHGFWVLWSTADWIWGYEDFWPDKFYCNMGIVFNFLGALVIRKDEFIASCPSFMLAFAMVQFFASVVLLLGIHYGKFRILYYWQVYNGLVMGAAVYCFTRSWMLAGYEHNFIFDGPFWMVHGGRVLAFFAMNVFVMFKVGDAEDDIYEAFATKGVELKLRINKNFLSKAEAGEKQLSYQVVNVCRCYRFGRLMACMTNKSLCDILCLTLVVSNGILCYIYIRFAINFGVGETQWSEEYIVVLGGGVLSADIMEAFLVANLIITGSQIFYGLTLMSANAWNYPSKMWSWMMAECFVLMLVFVKLVYYALNDVWMDQIITFHFCFIGLGSLLFCAARSRWEEIYHLARNHDGNGGVRQQAVCIDVKVEKKLVEI